MRNDLRFPVDDPRVIACKKAVKAIGGFTKTARHFGIKPQSVYKWEVVPRHWCKEVAALSGVSIYELRPDVFGFGKVRVGHDGPSQRKARGKIDANTNPASPASEEMERRAAAGGEGIVGERGDRRRGRSGDEHHPQPSDRPHSPRPRDGIARLFAEAKGQPDPVIAAAAEGPSTSTAECGYGGRSW